MKISGLNVYGAPVMNEQASTNSSISYSENSDAVSRRAYELWEKEGRPEGNDLRHWLQAEKELADGASTKGGAPAPQSDAPRNTGNDIRPLQGTRAASAANRENKRGSTSPFGEKNGGSQSGGRRKSTGTPLM